jgi:hypothetical protein
MALKAVTLFAFGLGALLAAGGAGAFELAVTGPDFTVAVPRLPAIQLEAQKTPAPPVTKAMRGDDGTYEVSLLVTQAERETSTRACAGAFLRALVARPGMPDRDSIYRAPLDTETFLVLYILGTPRRLHAHLLSSANASHCIELHVSKSLRDGDDEDAWRRSFQGARIAAGRR